MSAASITGLAITFLLALSALVCLLSSLGLLVMKGFYDKLHYLAPPAVLATTAVSAAILLQEGFNSCSLKTALVLVVTLISNPVLTYAAARAHHLRREARRNE